MSKFSHLTPPNVRKWIDEGYGVEDIAVRTHHRRDYVKAMMIKWELWPNDGQRVGANNDLKS
jgi:hypothetical protein